MNPYEVLDIPSGSSPEEIKAAYHRMAKQWHPDRFTGEAKVEAEKKFRTLAEAFAMLRDVVRQEPQRPAVPATEPPKAEAVPAIQLDTAPEDRPAGPKTAEDWYQDAKGAHEGKAHGRALALILYALRMEPERAEFHALHGRILDASGNDDRTKVKALETAIRLDPKDVESTILLAQTFQNLGMQARATRLWEVVHNLAPNHAVFKQAAKAKAADSNRKAKDLAPGLAEQWENLVAEVKVFWAKHFRKG
jgi:curved DNA-binding protein CbpA